MGGQHSNESSTDHGTGSAGDDTPKVNFEDFQVLRAIGKGSFGKVCIVQKTDTKHMYAMKYMNKLMCVQRDAFRNVLREIELLAQLNHPFLVNLWFTFQDDEDMFMVFDLLLGGDLRYHLNNHNQGRFEQERIKLYVCEIALALDYLRRMNVIHRDIKPDNIILDSDGHAHITDFNIATKLSENSLATSLTGTRPYIAPEIYRVNLHECHGYSYPVDWWSLGICVYEMLRGRRPFDIQVNMSPREALSVFVRTPLAVSNEWDPNLIKLLNDLLEFNPERRISSLTTLKCHSCFSDYKFEDVLRRRITPVYVPPKDSLNCDPTFELEEMIIESKPLHKKKKRLAKTLSQLDNNSPQNSTSTPSPLRDALSNIEKQFTVYNREKLLKDEEERLKRLEQELGIRPELHDDAIAKRLGRLD